MKVSNIFMAFVSSLNQIFPCLLDVYRMFVNCALHPTHLIKLVQRKVMVMLIGLHLPTFVLLLVLRSLAGFALCFSGPVDVSLQNEH